MIMTVFWICLNAVVIVGGFIASAICLGIVINNAITYAVHGNNETVYDEEEPQNHLAGATKTVMWIVAMVVCFGSAVHFAQLPIFPDAKERQRLVHEMKAIESEMCKDEISEDLYDRVVKYNDDNETYGAQHPGCEVGITFDEDEFNSFDVKCRVKNAYADYRIFMNGVEVAQDKITLSDYRNRTVRVNDEEKEIYISRHDSRKS